MKVIIFCFVCLLLSMQASIGQIGPPGPRGFTLCPGNAPLALSATTSSSRIQLGRCQNVIVTNIGSNTVYFAVGGSSVVATTSSSPLPANAFIILNVTAGQWIAGITASSTSTLVFVDGTVQ